MISNAPDVTTYIEELPAERRAAIEKLRKLCRRNFKGYEERIEYGMPVYKRNGTVKIAFASQKNYIALYGMKKGVLDEFRSALPGSDAGKGCLRFKNPDRMDFEVIERLLRRNAESKEAAC